MRPPAASDEAALAAFEQRAFRSYYAPHRFSKEQFRWYLTNPRTIGRVVHEGGRVIAYTLGRERRGRLRHVARLDSIAVDEGWRRQGLASQLMKSFLAQARRRGCRVVMLEVADLNDEAIRLFTRHGFVRSRRLLAYYSPTVDGIRMRRAL